ncbi:alpha/beta fold hydrolase [Hymenobacter montanus]|nr:alpha/beta hydrolase [Hymenobacter montanus]
MHVETQITHVLTRVGRVAVYIKESSSGKLPLIFLHGVYLDHHLWDEQIEAIKDRMVVAVDMPLHGSSRENIKPDWTVNDCAEMLVDILDSLQIPQVIAVGHSWGSMTILRAAYHHPERFASIGLCNMPFHAASGKQKLVFALQHTMLMFKNFYTTQAAKSLFGKTSLRKDVSLIEHLKRTMNILSGKDIKQIDKTVILNADDATELIRNLQVKAIALKGLEDYVPTPPAIETIIVEGGHISPLEQPQKVSYLINELLN